jgi:hypothetical protein
MLFADNPTTGKSGLMSFGPIDTSNTGQPFTAAGGPMSSTNEFNLPKSADELRSKFAALTVQTTPEQAQAVLDFIKKVSAGTPLDWYRVFSYNCTTVCRDAAKAAGLLPADSGQIAPEGLWGIVFQNYAKMRSYTRFSLLPCASPTVSLLTIKNRKGEDYGNPRFGMNTFDFVMHRLIGGCVESWDPKSNTLHGCIR